MEADPGVIELGPGTCELYVHTTREGFASKAGHDLRTTFRDWSGRIEMSDDDPASASISVEVRVASFAVLEGTGGVAPLTDDDRHDIEQTARKLLDAQAHPTATFSSTGVEASSDKASGTVEGTLTVKGTSAPLTLEVERRGEGWRGTATIEQTRFGITPYKAFFGALRLADTVTIEVITSTTSP